MEAQLGFNARITPELETLRRPIGEAKRHPDNVRKHDIPAIARSLQEHGQRTPIVVQTSTGLIVKGNGTHEAAELLGWESMAQSWQEMDDNAAMAYLLADNKASDQARYDRDKLVKALKDLSAGPGIFGTLWSEEELEEMEGPVARTVGEFAGDYVDNAEERQAAMAKPGAAKATGAKMKEVPVVLTIADHAVFIANVQRLQKLFGTSGTISTIVEAVRRQAEDVPNEQADLGDLGAIRLQVLKEARDFFLTDGKPTWTIGAIAAWFQQQLQHSPLPEPEAAPAEAPGQVRLEDLL